MNLYLRLIRVLLRQLWAKTLDNPLNRRFIFFRVWPHDCDFNLHLTNSRYLALMDLCRMDLMMGLGMGRKIMQHKWKFVVNAQEITYIKEVSPFSRFRISTQILGWDEKYFYVEHRISTKGKLHAIAHIRIAAVQGKRVVSMDEVFKKCGFEGIQPKVPEAVDIWKQLLEHKKWINHSQKS